MEAAKTSGPATAVTVGEAREHRAVGERLVAPYTLVDKLSQAISSAAAEAFLARLPHDYINLVTIDPGEILPPVGITRRKGDPELGRFIRQHAPTRNLYLSGNEPRPDAPDDKLNKGHIGTLRVVAADLDYNESYTAEQREQQVKDAALPPTFTVNTGGGLQAIWMLREGLPSTLENLTKVEDQGRGLALTFGGDAIQNIDRILRLPGTTNRLSRKKIARGRVPAEATLRSFGGSTYALEELAAVAQPRSSSGAENADPNAVPIDVGAAREDISTELHRRMHEFGERQAAFLALLAGNLGDVPHMKDKSGSGRLYTLAGFCSAAGLTPAEFAQVALSYPTCWPQGWLESDDSQIKRDLQRSWARVAAEGSSRYEPRTRAQDDFTPITKRKSKHKFERLHEITPVLIRRDLVKGLLSSCCTAAIVGPAGAGKSQLAASIVVAVAAGIPWCGRKTLPGTVIVAVGEGANGFRGRLYATREALKAGAAPVRMFDTVPDLLNQKDVDDFIEDCAAAAEDAGSPIVCVLLDTLTTCTPGMDQNSTEGMSRVVASLRRISNRFSCAVIVVHHTGKDVSRGARGSSVLIGDLDTELRVEDSGRGRFVVWTGKQRDYECPPAPLRFVSRRVVLGQDEDGEDVTTVYAEQDDSTNLDFELPGNDNESGPAHDAEAERQVIRAVQSKLRAGKFAKSPLAGNWVGCVIAEALNLDRDNPLVKRRLRQWVAEGYLLEESVQNGRAGRSQPIIRAGKRA